MGVYVPGRGGVRVNSYLEEYTGKYQRYCTGTAQGNIRRTISVARITMIPQPCAVGLHHALFTPEVDECRMGLRYFEVEEVVRRTASISGSCRVYCVTLTTVSDDLNVWSFCLGELL